MPTIARPQRSSWPSFLLKSMLSGLAVSLSTTAVAAGLAHEETGSALVSLNAVSHWIWGDHAAYRQAPSAKYTLTGFVIHDLASFFWAVVYERIWEREVECGSIRRAYAGAIAIAFGSYIGDYWVVPRRMTPGWDLRLSRRALAAIYVTIALVLPLRGSLWRKFHLRH